MTDAPYEASAPRVPTIEVGAGRLGDLRCAVPKMQIATEQGRNQCAASAKKAAGA